MRWKTYLALGRVSNLPTVWSNALAGIILSGQAHVPGTGPSYSMYRFIQRSTLGSSPEPLVVVLVVLSLSLFYVGGMFLNDAFDRHVDARIHPERPIPSGKVSAGEVFAIGFGLMAVGEVGIAVGALRAEQSPTLALGAGFALGALIVVYNLWHKNNPIGPLLMGGCRMLVYVTAALAVSGAISPRVWAGGAVLLSYLIGLTYVAKQETLATFANFWPLAFLLAPFGYAPWIAQELTPGLAVLYVGFLVWVALAVLLLRERAKGNIPKAVVRLIAGISLYDALFMSSYGSHAVAVFAVGCFGATLLFQRYIRGT